LRAYLTLKKNNAHKNDEKEFVSHGGNLLMYLAILFYINNHTIINIITGNLIDCFYPFIILLLL